MAGGSPRRVRAAHGLLIALCLGGLLVVVVLGTRLTFFNDDWYLLLQRPGLESGRGLDTLLAPHNGEIVALLVLLAKALVAVFGLGWQLPFRLVIGITVASLGGLMFTLVSARLGPATGLAAAAVTLFFGPAWEALLFFTALTHLGALTLGVAALLALESDTPRRNVASCLLLVGATLLFSLGVAFIAAALIAVALRRRPAQLWIPGVPAALFTLWWIGYGSRQPSSVTAANLEHLPRYAVDSISYGLASAIGLNHAGAAATLTRGHVLAALAGVAIAGWVLRGGRPTRWCLVFGAAALTWWILAGAAYIVGRGPEASRYQLTDAVLLILLAAELLRGVQIGGRARWGMTLAAALIVASNLEAMRVGYDFMRVHAGFVTADLGALELAGPLASAKLELLAPVAHDPYLSGVTAGQYFAQTRAHGTPSFDSPEQLAAAPADQRQAADSVLAAAYQLALHPADASIRATACRRLAVPASVQSASLPLAKGTTVLRNLSAAPLVVGVSRFAPADRPDPVGFLAGRSSAQLTIPGDSVALPWRAGISNPRRAGNVTVSVCRAG